MVHHAIFCLMAAFASNRMLVIDKPEEVFGLQNHFMPISQTCSNEKVQGINQVKQDQKHLLQDREQRSKNIF